MGDLKSGSPAELPSTASPVAVAVAVADEPETVRLRFLRRLSIFRLLDNAAWMFFTVAFLSKSTARTVLLAHPLLFIPTVLLWLAVVAAWAHSYPPLSPQEGTRAPPGWASWVLGVAASLGKSLVISLGLALGMNAALAFLLPDMTEEVTNFFICPLVRIARFPESGP